MLAAGILALLGFAGARILSQPLPTAYRAPTVPPVAPAPAPAAHARETRAATTTPAARSRPVAAAQLLQQPVAVVVGNNPAARPQAGLNRALQVWEALAEGGITRLWAVYAAGTALPTVGPVRSTRIYFDQLDRAARIPFAHAGGNRDALYAIPTWHLLSIDAIYGGGAYFWRSASRAAPNNLYTSGQLLNEAVRQLGLSGGAAAPPGQPAGPLPSGGTPVSAATITYARSSQFTNVVGWRWQSGRWVRRLNGMVARSASGQPIVAHTVLILVVPVAPDPSPHTPGSLKMIWSGGLVAWALRGGQLFAGQWYLGPRGIPEVSVHGTAFPVGQGPIWYELVPHTRDATFTLS